MAGLTLDSGALIGFERSDRRVISALKIALHQEKEVTIPTVVVAEVWRGGVRSARLASLLASSQIEPIDERVARRAGEALASARSANVIDALVMASASRRGDSVLTSDVKDLNGYLSHFDNVSVIPI